MVDEKSANQPGRHRRKAGTFVSTGLLPVDQLDMGQVHQRLGLQGVIGPLLAKIAAGQRSKLVIDQGQEIGDCVLVAVTESGEVLRHRL